MTIEQYIKFVLRFLKENKVYFAYLYNAREYLQIKHKRYEYLEIDCDNYIESSSQYLYKRNKMKKFIDYAFCWDLSREGFNFWEDINRKFENKYESEL